MCIPKRMNSWNIPWYTTKEDYIANIYVSVYFLKIRWDHFIPNDEVLDGAKSTNSEIILIRNILHWMGHVACMPDEQPVQALLYGVLEEGSRRVGRPLLRYKDTLKNIFSSAELLSEHGERS